MTPAEHRKAAEKLAASIADDLKGSSLVGERLALAQLHATLALAAAAAPPPKPRPRPAARVEVFDVELRYLAVTSTDSGAVVLDHPATDWSTLLDDPAQVRLLADTLTAHADHMENR